MEFEDGVIYPTRCPKCLEPTDYQEYRYSSTDHRDLPCRKCNKNSYFLDFFVKGDNE